MKPKPRVVIWGLKTSLHSHRYIHSGWFRTLQRAGYPVIWTDDRPSEVDAVTPGSVVFAVDVASSHLPILPDTSYVLHHIRIEDRIPEDMEPPKALHIKVWTNMAKGVPLAADLPCVLFDHTDTTLYQPWGTPFPETQWIRTPIKGDGKTEYWIGSIWNDNLNQGNAPMIAEWRRSLHRAGIRFLKVPRGWPDKPGPYGYLVRRSALAASVVGAWQERHNYLPCRTFKNLSFGALPVGNNSAYKTMFGDAAVVAHDLDEVIETARTRVNSQDLLYECQRQLRQYTHLASLERMLTIVLES